MITDLAAMAKGDAPLKADVCIVGAGAAGITIAREFIGTPHSVIVLEGGGEQMETASQDPYRSEVTGLAHSGVHEGRARVFGGTTTLWAGQVLPLFEIDFRGRPWVPESGWPIGLDELSPFYKRAEEVLQVPHRSYGPDSWPERAAPPPDYDPGHFAGIYSQFCREPSFARKYGDALRRAANVTVITHANVTSLTTSTDARVVIEANARSPHGASAAVQARHFIVCAGGIDSARLLLASDSVQPAGIGNDNDVVGRYFQDHPGVAVPITPLDARRFSHHYDSIIQDGRRHAFRIAATPEWQERERTVHVGAEVYYPVSEDDPLEPARRLVSALRDRRLSAAVAAAGGVAHSPLAPVRAAYRRLVLGRPASVGSSRPHLGLGGEQEPDPQSRVTLSSDRDGLGMRRTRLEWRVSTATTRSFELFARALDAEWRRLGLAALDLDDVVFEGRDRGEHGGFVDASHHMGTTRMGTDRRTSVVGPDCRVHGVRNLFIGSSAVFPTGGASNPTFTMLALCLRMADRLKSELAGSPGTLPAEAASVDA